MATTLPDAVGCAACGAEDSVPFNPIDFAAEPATVPQPIYGENDAVVGEFEAVNPLYYPTTAEYRPGNVYGHPAACTACGKVSMPMFEVPADEAPELPQRGPQARGVGIVATPPEEA